MGRDQCQMGIRWSSVAPRNTALDKQVVIVVNKLITDSEKATTEELNPVRHEVAIFAKGLKDPAFNMEVASWRHLVRVFPRAPLKHR